MRWRRRGSASTCDQATQYKQRGYCDELAADHDPRDVDRGLPPHALAVYDEHADRSRDNAESRSGSDLLLVVFAPAASTPAAYRRDRNDRHAVHLVRLSEHPLDGENVANRIKLRQRLGNTVVIHSILRS